ncbi:12121_t:CDS:2 [Acaulospora colombiana]|uniref:12121_t:CDS:1 n=1 Tax=Acaulospora colombiana TaxID=27376 RepID=A0ACA9JX78_9GLOM|nr:12121_t:CDS:2 [Acaulospora colombiana]
MNDQQKKQIEDITGKIPLFLNILLESGHPPSGYGVDDFDHHFFYIENRLAMDQLHREIQKQSSVNRFFVEKGALLVFLRME